MPVELELAPKTKRAAGEPCCEPVVYPDWTASTRSASRRSPKPWRTRFGCSWSTS
jgi:hypothetical protein